MTKTNKIKLKTMKKNEWEILKKFEITPDNLTVGGYLYLRGTQIKELPDNLTVGGYLYLDTGEEYRGDDCGLEIIEWQNGKYILIDGIFSEILHRKNNIIKAKKYGTSKTLYIVTDGNKNYAHGNTIKEAQEDLMFKVNKKSKSDYKDLNLKSKLKFNDAVICYRVITGSCRFGVKDFIKTNNVQEKDYTISEIINITKGAYGSDIFSEFFNNK